MPTAALPPVREYRFSATLSNDQDRATFREALVDLAGGFTEITTDGGTSYRVGLRGRTSTQQLRQLLTTWAPRTASGVISLEPFPQTRVRRDIYFLLPLLRNPGSGPRQPLFTNEQLAALWTHLAERFHFRPIAVQVYGEWRDRSGQLIPDHNLLIKVPDRGRGTAPRLRRFIRQMILAAPTCDQDYIYLSIAWRGEFIG